MAVACMAAAGALQLHVTHHVSDQPLPPSVVTAYVSYVLYILSYVCLLVCFLRWTRDAGLQTSGASGCPQR